MCSPHYPVTARMVTDQIHLEFDSDDETDGGDDNGEAEKPEEALVLAFRDDGYPLLPTIDSNTPLEMLKRVLRVYVREVRSKCSSSGRCASLTILISEFQKLSGRIPWAAIRANNDAHIVKKCQRTKYTLDDPSRMTHQAVLRFLNHWYSRQGDEKVWPLKFLKPERNAVAAVEPESARGRRDSTVSGGEPQEPQEEHIDDKGSDIEAHEDGKIEVDGGDNDNVSQQIPVEQVTGMGDKGGQEKVAEIGEVPTIPAQVDPIQRTRFLKSLSNYGGYQKLIGLLDTADVSDHDWLIMACY